MMNGLLRLSGWIDRINEAVAAAAAWLVLAAVLIAAGNAVSRKAFNLSSNAWLELQWYLFGAIFMLVAASALRRNEHVRVDIVFGMLSRRTQNWIELVGHIVFLTPFVVLMLYLLAPYVLDSIRSQEHSSNAGGLIIWPAKAVLLAGFVLLAAQGVSEIIKRAAILAGLVEDDAPTGHDVPIEIEQRGTER